MKASLWATTVVIVIGLAAPAFAQPEASESKFINSEGKDVGTLHISHMASATIFLLNLHDMPPGVHGIHIHAVGTCTPPSFDSAGPHFNPGNSQHGSKNPKGPHAGDLQNITIPANGKLETSITLAGMLQLDGQGGMLDGDGASIVIHANADDYTTDPSGNSGPRIACAKIFMAARQN
jgi:Cu-Zn family superoxide dismutase